MELHLSDGEEITCTPEHRFYVPGKGFEEAGTLSDGDRLVHDDDATSAHSTTAATAVPLKISDITWDTKATSLSAATTVYNFEVASTHTYFVGTESGGVWVHNDCLTLATESQAKNGGTIYRLTNDPAGDLPIARAVDPAFGPTNSIFTDGNEDFAWWYEHYVNVTDQGVYDPMMSGHYDPIDFDTWTNYWNNFPLHTFVPR